MSKKTPTPSTPTPVQIAVALIGGPTEVANLVGIKRQNVYRWLQRGRTVSDKALKQAELLSAATGGQIAIGEILSGVMERRRKDDTD